MKKSEQNAQTIGAVHTHTCSFKSLKNNADFAFKNDVKKTICEKNRKLSLLRGKRNQP